MIYSDIMSMPNGLDAKEIGERIGIKQRTAKKRLERAKIKPIGYSGPTAIYSEDVIEIIRNVPGRGRPPKAKPEDQAATDAKPHKP
jgi:hypothetical protein